MRIVSTSVAKAFSEGKAASNTTQISTGDKLFYHGNLIAKWENDGLWISNGNYVTYSRNGNEIPGSMNTKKLLNAIPGVDIWQANCKWSLNGENWDGSWINIKGTKKPEQIDPEGKAGNLFMMGTQWERTDGWRGYEQPIHACVGANDTGMWSDSPCPSNVREKELSDIKNMLAQNGIKTKQAVCQSSNVFCVHVYLVPQIKNVEKARELVKEYLANNETRLAYVVEQDKAA